VLFSSDDRLRLRVAMQIHERLSQEVRAASPLLPLEEWRRLLQVTSGIAHASERGWNAAAAICRQERRRLLRQISERLAEIARIEEDWATRRPVQSPQEIIDDLEVLEKEFDDVALDLKQQKVSVTTDAIVLEGINLGRFRIELPWNELPNPIYEVIAVDPHPAGPDSSKTHPHVGDNSLCEGDGRVPIAKALGGGRLLDFFVHVRQILETYNPGSAYVPLSRWNGSSCSDCGYVGDEDDSSCCDGCGSELCLDCSTSCSGCGRCCCNECRERCEICDEYLCSSCRRFCEDCDRTLCRGCRTDGRCGSCHQNHQESSDDEFIDAWTGPANGGPCEYCERCSPRSSVSGNDVDLLGSVYLAVGRRSPTLKRVAVGQSSAVQSSTWMYIGGVWRWSRRRSIQPHEQASP
jgi:hypothetical protein